MAPKRVRYQWFRDIPRNVSYRDYERFQFRAFGAFSLGVTAAALAIVAMTGQTLRPAEELSQMDSLSIEAAMTVGADHPSPVKLEGYLVTDAPLTMPDDAARRVIRGRLRLMARGPSGSDADRDPEPQRETLLAWEETVDSVFLSDGKHRIPLAFDLAGLPMQEETAGRLSPRIVRAGTSSRTSRPVAVEYGDQVLPLSPDVWGQASSVFVDLERQVLPYGQAVVVVAKVEATPQGNQLVDPLGDRLQVRLGTEDEIRQQGQRTRRWFLFLAIPLGFASFVVGRSAYDLWQEFVERSNQ
ncbi:MAG: hypothetical protein ACHWZW_06150 [Spirulina sp.]